MLQAQPFTTGANNAGYVLTSVDIRPAPLQLDIGTVDSGLLVRIVPNGTDNLPDYSDPTKIATLTNSASIVRNTVNTFTAPLHTTLAASTTYHVVVSNPSGLGSPGPDFALTTSHAEDSGKSRWLVDRRRPVLALRQRVSLVFKQQTPLYPDQRNGRAPPHRYDAHRPQAHLEHA